MACDCFDKDVFSCFHSFFNYLKEKRLCVANKIFELKLNASNILDLGENELSAYMELGYQIQIKKIIPELIKLQNAMNQTEKKSDKEEGATNFQDNVIVIEVPNQTFPDPNNQLLDCNEVPSVTISEKDDLSLEAEQLKVVEESAILQSVIYQTHCRCSEEDKATSKAIEFSVEDWITELDARVPQEPKARDILDNQLKLDDKRRRKLVKLICDDILSLWNKYSNTPENKKRFPIHCFKLRVALALVERFPSLKIKKPNGDYAGHEAWSTGNYGFIDYRLKYLKLDYINKKTQPENNKKNPILDEFQTKVRELKLIPTDESNKQKIIEMMAETRTERRQLIQGMKVKLVMQTFPKLGKFNGLLIHEEFKGFYPENDIFISKFREFKVSILKLSEELDANIVDQIKLLKIGENDDIVVITFLIELLDKKFNDFMATQVKRGRKRKNNEAPRVFPIPSLLKYYSIQDCISSKKFKSQTLLVTAVSNDGIEQNYFLRSDEFVMQVGNNFLYALDILIKFHILFEVKYAKELNRFYNFVKYLMGLGEESEFNKLFLKYLKYFQNENNKVNNIQS